GWSWPSDPSKGEEAGSWLGLPRLAVGWAGRVEAAPGGGVEPCSGVQMGCPGVQNWPPPAAGTCHRVVRRPVARRRDRTARFPSVWRKLNHHGRALCPAEDDQALGSDLYAGRARAAL